MTVASYFVKHASAMQLNAEGSLLTFAGATLMSIPPRQPAAQGTTTRSRSSRSSRRKGWINALASIREGEQNMFGAGRSPSWSRR